MKFVQFIQTEMEQLLEDWIEAAVKISPELRGENSRVLQGHAREMLRFICDDISSPQTDRESASKALGECRFANSVAAECHGSGRHDRGLTMLQMLQELRALRARVVQSLAEARQGLETGDIAEFARFNEAIDLLIVDSVASYSALKEQETRLLEAVFNASLDPAAIFATDGKLLYLNTPMAELANTTVREAIGRTPLELDLGFDQALHDAIIATTTAGQAERREFHHYLPSGRELYFDSQFVPVFDDTNAIEAVAKNSRDITDRKQAKLDSWRSANFDALTGLPNRRLFIDRLEQTLREAERNESAFAVLFIDLDGFKQTNDEHGHKVGDQLLAHVAERINNVVRAMDTVARIGGDEFTLILKETGREGAKVVAMGIVNSLEQGFDIESHQVQISCSIGLSVSPDDGNDVDKLIHNADLAMYVAKGLKDQPVQVYEPWMAQRDSQPAPFSPEAELDNALTENQLDVYYQPVIDIGTGKIVGAEALLRWHHPSRGLLTPDAFLGAIEKSGIMDSISAFVLQQAVTCAYWWRDQNDEAFPISINESSFSFVTQSLVDQWLDRLKRMSLDERWITIELKSESFNNIRASGVNPARSFALPGSPLKLAIDDFGIEPFSLSALQEFKVDSVKIGSELIKSACLGGDSVRQLKGIIAMAQAMNIKVVGVGVETGEQLQCLARAGCDYAQGFLLSRPLHRDDFEALLKKDRQKMAAVPTN